MEPHDQHIGEDTIFCVDMLFTPQDIKTTAKISKLATLCKVKYQLYILLIYSESIREAIINNILLKNYSIINIFYSIICTNIFCWWILECILLDKVN